MDLDEDRSRLVQSVVRELLSPRNALASVPHLDVSKPNFHDSKAEFSRELTAVETAIEALRTALRAVFPPGSRETEQESSALSHRLEEAVDQSARRRLDGLNLDSIADLIRKNKADTGYFIHALWSMIDLTNFLEDRLAELKAQERKYWNKSHRAPNYYARTIAIRLARLYASEKGERPTFGTARDGGHPSTNYGRALEKIFAALEITGGIKRPAKWAIEQLTDEDLQPRAGTGLLGSVLAPGPPDTGEPRKAIIDIANALTKGSRT